MVLVSATGFGTLAILAKLGYRTGLSVPQLLAYRFSLAAVGMVALAFAAGQSPLRMPHRRLLTLFVMGAAGYAGQALTFFAALRTLSASVTELVLYLYPTLVALGGWLALRRPITALHFAALPVSFLGIALLVGAGGIRADPALLLALASAVIYSTYILVGERVMPGTPPLAATSVTITGTTVVMLVVAAASRQLAVPTRVDAWAVLVALAVVPTMLAISLFLAALRRIGGAEASLLSTWEPVVTIALAITILGDRFTVLQAVGAALVLGAVVAVQAPRRGEKMTREQLGEPLPRRGEE